MGAGSQMYTLRVLPSPRVPRSARHHAPNPITPGATRSPARALTGPGIEGGGASRSRLADTPRRRPERPRGGPGEAASGDTTPPDTHTRARGVPRGPHIE